MVDLHVRVPESVKQQVDEMDRGPEFVRGVLEDALREHRQHGALDRVLQKLEEIDARLGRLEGR